MNDHPQRKVKLIIVLMNDNGASMLFFANCTMYNWKPCELATQNMFSTHINLTLSTLWASSADNKFIFFFFFFPENKI